MPDIRTIIFQVKNTFTQSTWNDVSKFALVLFRDNAGEKIFLQIDIIFSFYRMISIENSVWALNDSIILKEKAYPWLKAIAIFVLIWTSAKKPLHYKSVPSLTVSP